MERWTEIILIVGIILICAYSMKLSQNCVIAMENLTSKIDMMFIRS